MFAGVTNLDGLAVESLTADDERHTGLKLSDETGFGRLVLRGDMFDSGDAPGENANLPALNRNGERAGIHDLECKQALAAFQRCIALASRATGITVTEGMGLCEVVIRGEPVGKGDCALPGGC